MNKRFAAIVDTTNDHSLKLDEHAKSYIKARSLTMDKTIENVLARLAWTGKYTDSGQEVVNAGAVAEATQAITQAMLDVLPEKITAGDIENAIPANYRRDDNADTQRGYNQAISEMESAIKKIGGMEL